RDAGCARRPFRDACGEDGDRGFGWNGRSPFQTGDNLSRIGRSSMPPLPPTFPPMPNPIRFVFGVHLHQPVGNFDSVFEQHLEEVYRPFLEKVDERGFLPVVLHLSGPLLEWLERKGGDYLDLVGRLAADGKVELLCAGMYEPVLAALPRQDRVEQIGWLRDTIAHRFGVNATGLWLTERVWEPDLAADLAD